MNGILIKPYELEYIKNNFHLMSDKELGNNLNRSYLTVANVRAKMKLLRIGSPKPYSKDEILHIKTYYRSRSDKQLGNDLNRTVSSITNRRYKSGLVRATRKPACNSFIVSQKVIKMRELIKICETTNSPYQKDKAKEKLKKLSGL